MTKKKIEDVIEEVGETLERNEKNEEVNEFLVLTEKIKELEERNLRIQSEFQNYKRRTEDERIHYITQANAYLMAQILPVVDDFERALSTVKDEQLKSYLEGFNLIHNNMLKIMKDEGIVEIEALGKKFDATIHQAIATDHIDGQEKDMVIEVFQKGYTLNGKVIRPAMVKVNE